MVPLGLTLIDIRLCFVCIQLFLCLVLTFILIGFALGFCFKLINHSYPLHFNEIIDLKLTSNYIFSL